MTTDLDAAVARLKRDLDAIAAETSGAKEARGDVRLLLADWERLREMTSPAAGLARLEQELGIMDKTIAERDAARAELARLRERDARVSLMLQRGLAGATTQGKRASVRLDWCVHAVKAALALLKETP